MTSRPLYNFRLSAEAIWLIVNTVLGTLIVTLMADLTNVNSFGDLGDINTWLTGLGFGLVRTALGAILAAATGQFLKPGEVPEKPAAG